VAENALIADNKTARDLSQAAFSTPAVEMIGIEPTTY
jgi:hypothetical protein